MNLWQGDCLELMKNIPDGSVDMVLTDPPYNIARSNNFHTMGRAGIDFGEWDKNADLFSYIDEVIRVLKKGGSFVVFNDWKNLGDIARYSEYLGFDVKDMIRLEKSNPMPRNRERRYITDFECAVWLVKPKGKWVFNRQDEKYQRPKFVKSVEKGLHPTQKNLSLMEDLIKIHSNSGDIILDPFMGSGTTGVACKNLKRDFIGIELDEEYFNIAKERILNN
ncbi:MAG: site-specific DNA-methyltransferase [Haliea sp.]|nr:site-specific DNA-methyltransferase [Haliea sp.]